MPNVRLVTSARDLEEVARACASADRVGLDVESNGMFVYRARVCTVQLAWDDQVAIVDALATPLEPLRAVLAAAAPIKIVHDVAFDARILAEAGLALDGVHDTAIAARMLGRQATGLATLLSSELGLSIGKEMQQHDWSIRPLDAAALGYLATDVSHLSALDDRIFGEARARGIEPEILAETAYRIAGAAEAAREGDPRPPWARVKGFDKMAPRNLPVLRAIAEVREREAERRDVPVYKVMSAETLLAVAHARPESVAALRKMRGVSSSGDAFAAAVVRAIASARGVEALPEEERSWLERPRLAPAEAKARRERETRLTAWRRARAKERAVDEQAVLPGHCLKEIADRAPASREALAEIGGIGDFRVARDGDAILTALFTPLPPLAPAADAEADDAQEKSP